MSISLRHPFRVLCFVAAATALNFLPIELPGGARLFLAPFVYLPLVLLLPRPWSVLAAAIPMAATIVTLGYPGLFLLATIEAAWLALSQRGRLRAPIAADACFWAVAGVPASIAFCAHVAHFPAGITTIVVIKQALSHLVAVVLATFLARHTRLPGWLQGRLMLRSRMRGAVFHSVFLLAMVPLLFVTLGVSVLLRAHFAREDRMVLGETVEQATQQLGLFLRTHEAAVVNVAGVLSRRGGDPATLLEETRRTHPAFITMLIADAEGMIQHSAAEQPLDARTFASIADREYFRQARDLGRPFVSGVFRGRGFGQDILVAISAPIRDANGKFTGIVQASVEVRAIGRQIAGNRRLPEVGVIVADPSGRIIFAPPALGLPVLARLRHFLPGELRQRVPRDEPIRFDFTGADGALVRYVARAATAERGFVVIAQRPLLAGVKALVWVYGVVGFGAIGIVIAAAWVARDTNRRLAAPHEAFASATGRQAALGSLEPIAKPAAGAPYEIMLVFRTFNRLAVQLRRSYDLLRLNNEELDRRVVERTREAEEARRLAEAASQSKTDFLAMTSHEIRTPLNAIIGLTEALRSAPLDPPAAARLDTIHRSGERLLRVVNDLMDLSRIEAGKLELVPAPAEIGAVCREVRDLFALRAQQQGLELSLELEPAGPLWVEVDAARLQQVLINLVGNALKFTARGSVRLCVDAMPAGSEGVQLTFAVIDTGAGIAPEQQLKLFQPYVQLAAGRSAGTGSGLGLSISRRLVGLFGGTLGVRSRVGSGSVFHFSFFARPVAVRSPAGEAGLTRDWRVLVADDDSANQEVLRSMLETHCAHLVIVDGAQAAITALATEEFDVALIDLEMRDGDGFSVARAVRGWRGAEAARECRLIACSAHRRDEIWPRCREVGFDDYVEKPIERRVLFALLAGMRALAT